jgi:hypothetical protein
MVTSERSVRSMASLYLSRHRGPSRRETRRWAATLRQARETLLRERIFRRAQLSDLLRRQTLQVPPTQAGGFLLDIDAEGAFREVREIRISGARRALADTEFALVLQGHAPACRRTVCDHLW